MPKKRKRAPDEAPLLLQKRMPAGAGRKLAFTSWNLLLLLIACAVLTLCTLLLSYSNFTPDIFKGYFEKPLIVVLNYAIPVGICLLLFALLGRLWLAYGLTALLCLGVAVGNYYLVIIRNDPLQFADLTCIREALAITDSAGYELELSGRVVFAVLSGGVGMTALLAILSRWKLRWSWWRLIGLLLGAAAAVGAVVPCGSPEVIEATKHYKYIDTWSVTQIYVSRGVLFSFTNSALILNEAPEDYDEAQTAADLGRYVDQDIPAERKVDVIVVMRESYSDLSDLESTPGAIDFSCYDVYHAIAAEGLTGKLITNGFGGNTKNAERCFLTGNYALSEWRKPVNSYVWYLRAQGYRTEGAHPFNGWFYNRRNVNRYLGFEDYVFREDGFEELETGDHPVNDDLLYDRILEMYRASDPNRPYFHFAVTYEGHGPYHYTRNDDPTQFVNSDRKSNDGYAMNNYLSIAAHRDAELNDFVNALRETDRPVVLLTFGDHKATLGKDVNNFTTAAYEAYGMNLDLSTAEGFENYFSTEYLIWMNDAAKQILGVDPAGRTGPTISPCYLMNVLFDTLAWGEGPAYLQAMEEELELFPVYSTRGRVSIEGALSTTIPGKYVDAYHRMQKLSYYWRNGFFYEEAR